MFIVKSIYRLKKASRSLNIRFDQAIKYYGYDQVIDKPCVYDDEKMVFLVYKNGILYEKTYLFCNWIF